MPDPLLPARHPRRTARRTRTSSRRAWPGWSPRTRRCGWNRTRTPTRWSCGAWARRTRTSPWSGCAAGTASRSTSYRTRSRCGRRSAAGSAGRGRHVKQSGGHGQFAICEIEVEPLPGGSGIEFVDKVVGGAVPRQFIPSVEKGVRAQAGKGVAAGYPLVDVRVTLLDGKAHSVDSSDAAFQTAGALALREAAADARDPSPRAGRRGDGAGAGRLRGVGDERPVRPARPGRRHRAGAAAGGRSYGPRCPEIEIGRYAVDLRSLSHGTGRFDRAYARHEPMPPQLAEQDPRTGRRTAADRCTLGLTGYVRLHVGGRLVPSATAMSVRRIRWAPACADPVPCSDRCAEHGSREQAAGAGTAASGGDSGGRRIRFQSRGAGPALGLRRARRRRPTPWPRPRTATAR